MNPAANTGVSGGLAGAIVTIIDSWFVALHFAPMTPDIATAYMVVLTASFGYFFHNRTQAGAAAAAARVVAEPLPVAQVAPPQPAAPQAPAPLAQPA